eukprot:11751875-Karenia_brevis.AAC.1
MALWKLAASRRQDMEGIEHGIDRVATLALISSTKTDKYRQGLLRSILTGAVRTRFDLFKAGAVDSPICPYCTCN